MDFQLLKQVVNSINQTVVNTGSSAVKVLKSNLFQVKVTNPVTKMDIKGQVTVANQKNVEQLIKDLRKTTVEFSKKTHDVKVSNWQVPQKLTSLENGLDKVSNSVEKLIPELKNVAKEAKQAKTDVVEVSNIPTKELKAVLVALELVQAEIKRLKLDPKIEVKAPIIPAPVVNVQPTPVTIEKDEFDYEGIVKKLDSMFFKKDPTHYLPVRLSDGKLFYEAITRIAGGVSRMVQQKEERTYDLYTEKIGNATYVCEAVPGTALTSTGWRIKRFLQEDDHTYGTYANHTVDFDKIASDKLNYTY